MEAREWSSAKKWNPFNSDKLLAQVYRWRKIRRGAPIPQPSLVTVDPINACNLDCTYCNSATVKSTPGRSLSDRLLRDLADFLPTWQSHPDWERGVEAVCVAGGGEPLLNPHVGPFIERCVSHGVQVGVVTNGTRIDSFLEPLSKCVWVGVSVDAASGATFAAMKGEDRLANVLDNIKALVDYSRRSGGALAQTGQGCGVTYKYLLHPLNVSEVCEAVRKAKAIGCRNFHLRPVGVPWFRLDQEQPSFTFEMLQEFQRQIDESRRLEDDRFGIFGITHKFGSRLDRQNWFARCHAVFMTFVVAPPGGDGDRFNLGLCCDRRGDAQLLLGEGIQAVDEIPRLWGSAKHWQIFDGIRVAACPRCTYQPHNQIFENVIENDNMTYRFI